MSSHDPEVLPPAEGDAKAEAGVGDAHDGDDPAEIVELGGLEATPALADGSPIVEEQQAGAASKPERDRSERLPAGPGPASALTRYMAQLRHHAPISREEEHALAVRWREEGDVEAARQLVLSNLRLVVKIAMEYRRAWTNTLDLIQEGNVGLLEAVQRYDPYQGVKLSSYAVYWIRAYILKYILDNMLSVRRGTTRASRKLFFRLNNEQAALERIG